MGTKRDRLTGDLLRRLAASSRLDLGVGGRPLELAPTDTALLCADGLMEAGDDDGRPFGMSRIAQLPMGTPGRPAAIASRPYAAVAEHHDLDRLDDGASSLIVRRR